MKCSLTSGLLVLFAGLACVAHADVVFAKRGLFGGQVQVRGKAPNTVIHIWQSDAPFGIRRYHNTGFTVVTDENGDGETATSNHSSGTLLTDYTLKTGSLEQVNSSQRPCLVLQSSRWFSALAPGDNPEVDLLLDPVTESPAGRLLQTWEPGMTMGLHLTPGEAQWLNSGLRLECEGDVQAQIIGFSAQQVMIRIVGDPSPLSGDRIRVRGLGVRALVPPGHSIGTWFSAQGTSRDFVDGALKFERNFPTPVQFEYQRVPVAGPRILEGVVHLEDYGPSAHDLPTCIEIRDPVTQATLETHTVTLHYGGRFWIAPGVPSGTYAVAVKASHWLRATRIQVVLNQPYNSGFTISLRNGDCDGDNEVAIGDYAVLSQAFGSLEGDQNYSADADLDGSGEIEIIDFAILSANFGLIGSD